MKIEPAMLAWAFPAHIFFGLCNFFIGLLNLLGGDPWTSCGVMWISSGIIGATGAMYLRYKSGTIWVSMSGDDKCSDKIPLSVKIISISGGLCVGLSQFLMKTAFSLDPDSTGPLCAVISSDCLVVSVVSHFLFNERMTGRQWSAIGLVVAGLCTMVAFGGSGAHLSHITSISYAFSGMISFALSVLCIRYTCINDLSPWSGFIVRMLALLFVGAITLTHRLAATQGDKASVFGNGHDTSGRVINGSHQDPESSELQIYACAIVAIVAGILQAAGVYAVTKALMYPNTGVCNAIFSSNSITVLLLGIIFLHQIPTNSNMIGMVMVVCGIIIVSFGDKAIEDLEATTPLKYLTPRQRNAMRHFTSSPLSNDMIRNSLLVSPAKSISIVGETFYVPLI